MRRDLPTIDPTTEPFWSAARDGELWFNRCDACDLAFAYPRPFCPNCWSKAVQWQRATGRGTLYTYSIVYQNDLPPFADQVPYVAAIVDLAEGPRLMTRIVDCDIDALHVGMDVEVQFEHLDDEITVPYFRPSTAV